MITCDAQNLIHNAGYLLASFCTIGVVDLLLYASRRNNSRWFKLHLFANIFTVIFSASDFFKILGNPLVINNSGTLIPANLTLALHLYHALMFNNLTAVDWAHHVIMMSVLGLTFICPHVSITNYLIFVTNGFPGGVDYFLLILVKGGYLSPVTEKAINSKLNIWIRGPFILIGAYIIYIQWLYSLIDQSLYRIAGIVCALYWNAQYFTERVVYNYGCTASASANNEESKKSVRLL